jgi:hypothetical protein
MQMDGGWGEVIWINEAKESPERPKKHRKQINEKFVNVMEMKKEDITAPCLAQPEAAIQGLLHPGNHSSCS